MIGMRIAKASMSLDALAVASFAFNLIERFDPSPLPM
jgi:hypothetical protein